MQVVSAGCGFLPHPTILNKMGGQDGYFFCAITAAAGWIQPAVVAASCLPTDDTPVALGRKNWLFVGSERGGHAAALYMSLIQSCKNCDINPWEYLNDMLRRICLIRYPN